MKWGVGTTLLLLLSVVAILALRPQQNECVAISEEAGVWSAFIPNHYVPILAPLTRDQIDFTVRGRYFYVGREYLEAQAPPLMDVVGPPYSERGLIYPKTDFETHGDSYFYHFGYRYAGQSPDNVQTRVDDHGLMWFGEGLFDDDEWTSGLVFSEHSNPIDWSTLLGDCRTFIEPMAKSGLSGLHLICEFNFYWKGLEIDYDIQANMAHRYREAESFLKQHVICDIPARPAPESPPRN